MLRFAIPLLAILLPATAVARPIAVEFEAVVTEVVDDFELLPGVELGSVVTGAYLYDDKIPATTTGLFGSTVSFDFSEIGQAGFEFEVGGSKFNLRNKLDPAVPLLIVVRRNVFPVYDIQWSRTGFPLRPTLPVEPALVEDSVMLRISGPQTSETPTPPLLADAISAVFDFVARYEAPPCPPNALCLGPTQSRLSADLRLLRIVSEPHALALLGIATAGLLAARRRRL